jgi:ribonuclease R
MLIEEFMVIANEEVARWCDTHGLPFLSRVHGIPPFNSVDVIRKIIGKSSAKNQKNPQSRERDSSFTKGAHKSLEPKEIRDFLDALAPDDVYRYSRLLLPKMSKAVYTDRKHRHFGLALEYYAHFTSPIRRYPDLQVHRIIKEKLHGTLTEGRIIHYQKILKKVARHCSERERTAEDIERAFDSLYALRYMEDKVGQTFSGRVAGIAEFAYFVELASGIEVTVYLPRERRYIIDPIEGVLSTIQGKRIVQVGEKLKVEITGIMNDERRIVGERL